MVANLVAAFFFGAVGFVAFAYGKKQGSFKPMAIGAILLIYPYFISNTIALYAVGIILTVSLFIFRE
ncbi:MAG: hypothetical protein HZB36_08780 [Candidatus Omnitrophica bacterium]|nr:hypothetical protein [Candidatus Omnitrophota bacterium]